MIRIPGKIHVLIECPGLPKVVTTANVRKGCPDKTIKHLNEVAMQRGTNASYRLATEEEFKTYQKTWE